MTWLKGSLLSFVVAVLYAVHVSAIASVPTPESLQPSPLLITEYSVASNQTSLDFVQLYNTEDTVVDMSGWKVGYITTDGNEVMLLELHGYVLPGSHLILTSPGVVSGQGTEEYASFAVAGGKLRSIVMIPPAGISRSEQPVATSDGVYRRATTTTGYSTSTTFTKLTVFSSALADPLYIVPSAPQVRIVEIVAHSADCAPNDMSLVCGDYVKLYNPTDVALDISDYRLRTDSSTSESSNAFALNYILEAHAYLTVYLRSDGAKMSLTDSGGYVWLEDAYGVTKFYDETMVGYPSAGSDSKQGWAWMITADNVWTWTSTPQPDAPNLMTVPLEIETDVSECPAGKYRNPETNRCKNIEDAIATLIACDEDEYRSSETNRCRKLVTTTSAALAPCDEGQERNPATNRCRQIAALTTLAECPVGQTRNPDTNRCRKDLESGAVAAIVEPPKNPNMSLSILGGVVAAGAIGYGIWEWRSDIAKLSRRLLTKTK